MKLSEIFEQAKGRLSHAEMRLYLAFCSYADNDSGECFPKSKTVAERADLHTSTASTYAVNLEKKGFLRKTKSGYLCLVGFEKSLPETKKSLSEINFLDKKTLPEANKTLPETNQSLPETNSFINNYPLTTHLTNKEVEREEINSSQTGIHVSQLNPSEENQKAKAEIEPALTKLKSLKLAHSLTISEWRIALSEAEAQNFDLRKHLDAYLEWLKDKLHWKDSITAKDFLNHLHEFEPPPKELTPQETKNKIDYYLNLVKTQVKPIDARFKLSTN